VEVRRFVIARRLPGNEVIWVFVVISLRHGMYE